MTPEKIKKWKENLSKGSKRNWQKAEYRAKVIASNTGKKRTEEFRKGQSERTKQSYVNDPELRKKRGELFSKCWKDGRNHYHGKASNRSKAEEALYSELETTGKYKLERTTIYVGNNTYYYPDILINGKFIVEFYGDYWHANPKIYPTNKVIRQKTGMTVDDIHAHDATRQKALEDMGYKYMVVWQSDWNKDKNLVLENIEKFVTNA